MHGSRRGHEGGGRDGSACSGGDVSGGGGGSDPRGSSKSPRLLTDGRPKPGASSAAADWRFRHLTNYAINRNHPDFVSGGDDGSKRLLSQVLDSLDADGFDVDALWGEVQHLFHQTLPPCHPPTNPNPDLTHQPRP